MENELELRVGDVVRLKPLTVEEVHDDGDILAHGFGCFFRADMVEEIIFRSETDAEKIARLTNQLADAKNVIKTQEDELAKTPRKIEWNGGEECPVDGEAQVLVWIKNGEYKFFGSPKNCPWGRVAAYMVIPE